VLCPRFFPGITKKSIKAIIGLAEKHDLFIHTHASETKEEVKFAIERYGCGNVEAMGKAGMLSSKAIIAHCIHISDGEMNILADSGATAVHCPSANMKLGSGIAKLTRMSERGVNIALGSDGAPCNNNMNQIFEMRLAGLLQKAGGGADKMPAKKIFEMATVNGAKALNMENRKGRIKHGYDADFLLIERSSIHIPQSDINPFSSIIYSLYPSDIKYVFSEGRMLKENGVVGGFNTDSLSKERKKLLKDLLSDRL